MRRASRHCEELGGQDSFLDIVANLVGVLIILVMVMGVRAKDAWVEAAVKDKQPAESVDVETPKITAAQVEADIHNINRQLEAVRRETQTRYQERGFLQTLATAARQELSARRDQLDRTKRDKFDLIRALAGAKGQLQLLQRQRDAVENSTAPPTVIEHTPTPLAKTVFGVEEHFRLLNHRVTHIPWNELVEKLKAQAPGKVPKMKGVATLTESIGPLNGFLMRYTLKRVGYQVATRLGAALHTKVELDQFLLIPVADDLGEPLDEAIQPGSEFRELLAMLDARRTTITVWTYPDSYDDFRVLKKHLLERGFLTAGRPMPAGQLIGGSPTGTRSAAE